MARATLKEMDVQKSYCYQCGKLITVKNVVRCYSKRYSSAKILPICNECLMIYTEELLETYETMPIMALYSFLQSFDVPLLKKYIPGEEKDITAFFLVDYLRHTNTLEMRDKGFIDGDYITQEEFIRKAKAGSFHAGSASEEETEINKLMKKFGFNAEYNSNDYYTMENYYKSMLVINPDISDFQKDVIKSCASMQIQANKLISSLGEKDSANTMRSIENIISNKLGDNMLRTKDKGKKEIESMESWGIVTQVYERKGKNDDILKRQNKLHLNQPRDVPDYTLQVILDNISRNTNGIRVRTLPKNLNHDSVIDYKEYPPNSNPIEIPDEYDDD